MHAQTNTVNVLLGPQLVFVSNTMWTGWQPTVPKLVTNVPVPTNTASVMHGLPVGIALAIMLTSCRHTAKKHAMFALLASVGKLTGATGIIRLSEELTLKRMNILAGSSY